MNVELVDVDRAFFERVPAGALSFSYSFAPFPSWAYRFDLFVMPVKKLEDVPADFVPPASVFAFGPARLLAFALSRGCADYLKEPWDREELEARAGRFVTLDLGPGIRAYSDELRGPNGRVMLGHDEWVMLRLLAANRGRSVPRLAFEKVMEQSAGRSGRALDMRITRLRKKCDQVANGAEYCRIVADRGIGYRLYNAPVDKLCE